ncbi:hypothetical protein Daus18300_010480 [Diaporthe australafricana]|uniref:Deleted in azoospermia-associated protein 2 n=1 Tax=Diaporthe australafricana TaxID=127596 RepID=A0ABR3WAD9_9PEZI
MPNYFITRPYQPHEPFYQVPNPGSYPPSYAKAPVSGTFPATVLPTAYQVPQTYQYLPSVQMQPAYMAPRQPQLWYPAYVM